MRALNEKLISLIERAASGDAAAMDEIVRSNERLIWDVAKRFYGRGCEAEDLFQLGAMGLIKAVKNFDLSRGLALSTYAVPMIMGEIKRFLRDDGPLKVGRNVRELAAKARRVASELAVKNGREASLKARKKKLPPHLRQPSGPTPLTALHIQTGAPSLKTF